MMLQESSSMGLDLKTISSGLVQVAGKEDLNCIKELKKWEKCILQFKQTLVIFCYIFNLNI